MPTVRKAGGETLVTLAMPASRICNKYYYTSYYTSYIPTTVSTIHHYRDRTQETTTQSSNVSTRIRICKAPVATRGYIYSYV